MSRRKTENENDRHRHLRRTDRADHHNMQHDTAWDRAIDEVCRAAADPKVTHLLYSRNGSGTPGHPRISEQREMGRELAAYLASFGPTVWD